MKNFDLFAIFVLFSVTALTPESAKAYKRVVVHVPMKVKHHHHTHTVYKHVHHQVPVHYDHHDVHVIHPETSYDEYDNGDVHISHGRTLESLMGEHLSDQHDDRDSEYEKFEKLLKRHMKNKKKLFNNMVIGWRGRSDFDKIASEYLESINRQRTPESDYDDHNAPYEEMDSKKRK